jgi:hypothetical protein
LAWLGVTALVGLTFLAYKHPPAYRRILQPMTFAVWTYYVGLGVWNVATLRSQMVASNTCYGAFLDSLKVRGFTSFVPCRVITEQMTAPGLVWWLLPGFFMLYLVFLDNLPKLIKEDHEESPTTD